MNRKIIISVISLLILQNTGLCQPFFDKTYRIQDRSIDYFDILPSKGGYLALGMAYNKNDSVGKWINTIFYKLDSSGNHVSDTSIGETGRHYRAWSYFIDTNLTYLWTLKGSGTEASEIEYLLFFDSELKSLDTIRPEKAFIDEQLMVNKTNIKLNDSLLFFTGTVSSGSNRNSFYKVLDRQGKLINKRQVYTQEYLLSRFSLQVGKDSVLMCGGIVLPGISKYERWYALVNPFGDDYWRYMYTFDGEGGRQRVLSSAAKINDTLYVLAGTVSEYCYFTFVTSSGKRIKEVYIDLAPREEEFKDVYYRNGSLYFTGLYLTDTSSYYFLSKFSLEGKLIWIKYLQYAGWTGLGNTQMTSDGFIYNGYKRWHIPLQLDEAWILKIDTNGCIIPGCKPDSTVGTETILLDNSLMSVYPNPSDGTFTVELNGKLQGLKENKLKLFDANGQEILITEFPANKNTMQIKTKPDYQGILYLQLKTELGNFYKKIFVK